MKSKASWFNPALFRSNLRRFAPLWGVLLGILVLTGPFVLFPNVLDVPSRRYGITDPVLSFQESLWTLENFYVLLNALMGFLCALFCFKYLHSERSVYLLHSLPLTRKTLFWTNAISGFVFALGPGLICCLLITLCGLFVSGSCFLLGMRLFAFYSLQFLCFFGFGVFCMMITGRTVIAVLSYPVLILLGFALPAMTRSLIVAPLFVGIGPEPDIFTSFSPLLHFFARKEGDLLPYLIWSLVGIGVLLLSRVLYARRPLERTGNAMVFSWAGWAFQILFTWIVGILQGRIVYLILSGLSNPYKHRLLFFIAILLGVFVAWFAARMMLRRSTKVFRNKADWRGFWICAAVLAGLLFILSSDLLHLQRWTPTSDEVRSVTVITGTLPEDLDDSTQRWQTGKYGCFILDDPAEIDQVIALHKDLYLENKKTWDTSFLSNLFEDSITLKYSLKNGATIYRSYILKSEKTTKAAEAVFRSPKLVTACCEEILQGEIECAYLYSRRNACTDPDQIRAAVLKDAAAGRIVLYSYSTSLFRSKDNNLSLELKDGSVIQIRFLAQADSAILALFH